MMMVKNSQGREFYVETEGREIYVGTPAAISTIAAQIVVHEALQSTGLKSSNTWKNLLTNDGNMVLGVGYKIPMFCDRQKAIDRVEYAIKAYVAS